MLILPGDATNSIEFRLEGPLPQLPKFFVSSLSVSVGPYYSASEHESHFLETAGSGQWYPGEGDEVRFDPSTGVLSSLILRLPDNNSAEGYCWSGSSASRSSQADLSIPAEGRVCNMPSASLRCISPSGDLLAGLWRTSLEFKSIDQELVVTPSLSLVASRGSVVGWSLSNPERYIADSFESTPDEGPDSTLANVLARYLSLVDEAAADQMLDGDTFIRSELLRMIEDLDVRQGAAGRRLILIDAIQELLDFYY
ncbi:hypothetical protein ABZ805_02610 [Saccharopolyspora sp. NPDC047091]|uniref:hypothetical protein n=1 Tax=Saccharopolyspora sp. NPDC047091 TaxID=3155924 RepID=UPI0033E03042